MDVTVIQTFSLFTFYVQIPHFNPKYVIINQTEIVAHCLERINDNIEMAA